MRLRSNFVAQNIADEQYLVPVGKSPFQGLLHNNQTAAFIINCLTKETSVEEIVETVYDEYDAGRETIETDVMGVLDTLRGIGALEEA